MSPQKWLVAWYLALIVVGAVLLSLPPMTPGGGLAPIDALFTSASSVCVTGLMVLDIQSDFTMWGRLVILGLVQLGGIGIITLASVFILSASRNLPIRVETMMSSAVPTPGPISIRQVVLSVVRLTLIIEAIGALALFLAWPGAVPVLDRAWLAVFHAVSAFCNAGISLFANSLESFRDNVAINVVIMCLITLGGFGFINLKELLDRFRTRTLRWSHFSLFLKVSITFTVLLNVAGALALFAFEYNRVFAGLSVFDKAMASTFQSITARTAGFNTVPTADLAESTLRIVMALMFIGAVGGSCAGGIKVGTLAILLAVFRSYVRNDSEPVIFRRRLSRIDQRNAIVLLVVFGTVFYLGYEAMLLLERDAANAVPGHTPNVVLEFETISALGTVGLSTGVTPFLSTAGKAVIIVLMVIGRLGPLALIAAWSQRPTPRPFTYPEEQLPVG